MSVYDDIPRAIETRLLAMAGIPAAVSFENVLFEPPAPSAGNPWLRVTHLPAEVGRRSAGANGTTEVPGVTQISVFSPSGAGAGPARRLANTIAAWFKSGTSLAAGSHTVRVTKSWRASALQEPDWYHVPVLVAWWCETSEL